ncbi:MAG: hypothetical protein II551_06015, partial [Paludibacteraceae bacterium]|nr:hypothetical protein [Paludibacteraceae bacterium]
RRDTFGGDKLRPNLGQVKKITRISVAKWGNFRPTVYIVHRQTKNRLRSHSDFLTFLSLDSNDISDVRIYFYRIAESLLSGKTVGMKTQKY